jgi:hypothetical protein
MHRLTGAFALWTETKFGGSEGQTMAAASATAETLAEVALSKN